MDTGQWIAIGLSVLLGVWYLIGAIINRRRGIATYHWLHAGLTGLGKVNEAKWIGSAGTGARLVVGQANKPFRRIEVIFLLESREIMPLWLFNRLRKKQDEMIFKATLRRPPFLEIEVAPAGNRRLKELLAPAEGKQAAFKEVSAPSGFTMLTRGRPADDRQLTAVQHLLERYPQAIIQFSLRRQIPHLLLRLNIPPLCEAGNAFWDDLSQFMRSDASTQ